MQKIQSLVNSWSEPLWFWYHESRPLDVYPHRTSNRSEVTNHSSRFVFFLEIFNLIHRKLYVDPSFKFGSTSTERKFLHTGISTYQWYLSSFQTGNSDDWSWYSWKTNNLDGVSLRTWKSPTIFGQDPCYCYLSHGYAFLLGKFFNADQPVSIAAFLCTLRNIPVNDSFVGWCLSIIHNEPVKKTNASDNHPDKVLENLPIRLASVCLLPKRACEGAASQWRPWNWANTKHLQFLWAITLYHRYYGSTLRVGNISRSSSR